MARNTESTLGYEAHGLPVKTLNMFGFFGGLVPETFYNKETGGLVGVIWKQSGEG